MEKDKRSTLGNKYNLVNARDFLIPFEVLLEKYPELGCFVISVSPPKFDLGGSNNIIST